MKKLRRKVAAFKKTKDYKEWLAKSSRVRDDNTNRSGPTTIDLDKRVNQVQENYLILNRYLPKNNQKMKKHRKESQRIISSYISDIGAIMGEKKILKWSSVPLTNSCSLVFLSNISALYLRLLSAARCHLYIRKYGAASLMMY